MIIKEDKKYYKTFKIPKNKNLKDYHGSFIYRPNKDYFMNDFIKIRKTLVVDMDDICSYGINLIQFIDSYKKCFDDVSLIYECDYVYFNYGDLCLPIEALHKCYHSGSCNNDVNFWVDLIDWNDQNMSDEKIKIELSEFGAWSEEELNNIEENRKHILWIASGNYKDQLLKEENNNEE